MPRPAPLGRRELAILAGGSILLAILMSFPLVARLDREVPGELGDPLLQAWEVAWGGHALRHGIFDYFQANAFWPLPNSLAFSDALVGYAPFGLAGSGATAAVARYNLLFLFAHALAFAGAYLLARELGAGRFAGAAAGAAYAYAPWRISQLAHLNVLSSGGIPLALFLLVRGYRSGRPGLVLSGWLVAAWQVSLGFVLGIQIGYLLLALCAGTAVFAVRRRSRPDLRLAAATGAGAAALIAVTVAIALPYLEVLEDHPEAKREPGAVGFYSLRPASIVSAPNQSLVWGAATEPLRSRLEAPNEQSVFPGLTITALAVLGLLSSQGTRSLRVGLGLGVAVTAAIAIGFDPTARWLYPFNYLYEYAPGWRGVRVPGRIMALTTLGLALLAALGAERVRTGLRGRRSALVAGLLVAAVLLEGYAGPELTRVPSVPEGQRGTPAPQLHLPSAEDGDSLYMFWSVEGFPEIVNGYSAFVPASLATLREQVAGFPDRESVRALRALGIRTVVLHPELARSTPWAQAVTQPTGGLGLSRSERDGVVVFRLVEGSAG